MDEDDEEVIELTRRKIEKAEKEETKFEIGDHVRFIINKKLFEKGTLPKWSKVVHKIISKTGHIYTLDNNKNLSIMICKKSTTFKNLTPHQVY